MTLRNPLSAEMANRLLAVALLLILPAGFTACSGSRATTDEAAEESGGEERETLSVPDNDIPGSEAAVDDNIDSPDDDRDRQQMERALFERLYDQYQPLYNKMIQEYFQAQQHLTEGNYTRARAAARRASSIIPNQASYELLLVILQRSGAEQEQIDEWTGRLEQLRELEEQGLYLSPDGDILSADGELVRTDGELGSLDFAVPVP